jgi:VWFA-related protein
MRRLIILAFLVFLALPAFAVKRITVAQLEQVLATAHASSDAVVAEQIAGYELTERLSAIRYARLSAALPGEKARQALLALADSAEFHSLPPDDIPTTAAPDFAEQRRMMSLVVGHVTKAVHQLPNLFATRATTRFEDRPQGEYGYLPLHVVGNSRRTVLYRDGQEMVDAASGKSGSAEQGLVSWGEFGPILSTVLLDAAQNKLAWSHWEQGANGPLAVFAYAVPEQKSHYWVQFCCTTGIVTGIQYSKAGLSGVGANYAPILENYSETPRVLREKPAYHGEIAIDPGTGAILRMTADAELPLGVKLTRAAIMVEYGSVEIGGKSFICPERSVALSLIRYAHATKGAHSILDHDPLMTLVNDVTFEQYHRLGAEARILTVEGGDLAAKSPDAQPPDASKLQPASGAQAEPPVAVNATPSQAAQIASAPDTASSRPAPQSASLDASAPEAAPAYLPQTQLLKASASNVLVDVVVTDAKQKPALGLGKQLFEVLEDGKPQIIDFFEEHTAVPAPEIEALKLPANLYTNLPTAPVSDSVNVLLIDKVNTPLQDQVRVHKQIIDFIQKMNPGTKIAIFVLSPNLRLLQGFTSDSAQLQTALNDPRNGDTPETTYASRSSHDDAEDEEHVQMQVEMSLHMEKDVGDGQSSLGPSFSYSSWVNSGRGPARGQDSIAANQAREQTSITLTALESLARYLAGIPGRKNLIWFSSSFPVSIFPSTSSQRNLQNGQNLMLYYNQGGSTGMYQRDDARYLTIADFNPAAKEVANLLALSHVAVYPVNAESVQMDNAMETSNYGPSDLDKLTQQADQRAIETVTVNRLANDTGGKAFYNTNDLAGALAHAIDDGAHYYTLAYTPVNKNMDGSFRRIQVRLKEGSFDLAYRRGYYADDHAVPEPKTDSNPLHPLLKRGAPASSQIVFSARLLAAAQQTAPGDKPAGGNTILTGPLTRYRVDFNIRPSDLELIDSADGKHTGKIQVELLAYDGNGAALNWNGGTMAVNLSAESFAAVQRTGIPAHLEIDLPSSALYLEAGVYDWTARKAGTLEIPLHPVAEQSELQAKSGKHRN